MIGLSLVLTAWPLFFPFAIVAMIVVGKFLVQTVGRWGVFGRSRLRAGRIETRPRGLVEYESCENI